MNSIIVALVCAASLAVTATDQKGVEYGRPGGHPLLLDLHVPDGPGPFPAAILVHGGGFDAGSRATNMAPTFQPLADAGFAWFSIDYRMAPEFRFPEAREDIDTAIKWVKANAHKYKVIPRKSCWPVSQPAGSSSTTRRPTRPRRRKSLRSSTSMVRSTTRRSHDSVRRIRALQHGVDQRPSEDRRQHLVFRRQGTTKRASQN